MPKPVEKPKAKQVPVSESPYAQAIASVETMYQTKMDTQRAKSAAAQKALAESEEVDEIVKGKFKPEKQAEAASVLSEQDPKQRPRVLNFDSDDQFTSVQADIRQQGDGAWGTAAAAEGFDENTEKKELATKKNNEK